MKKNISLLCLLSLLLFGCSTDFNVIAPYKEVMIIDGLLNPVDTVQYVRVKKGFLGEGNVLVMAQVKDSSQYADILDVKMQRLFNNGIRQVFSLQRVTDNTKDTGAFYSPNQVLYKMIDPVLTDGSEYRIIITNRQSGLTVQSLTKIVKDVTPPYIRDPYDLATAANAPAIFTSVAGTNSSLYDFIVRFHYTEYDSTSGVTDVKLVEWNFSDLEPPLSFSYSFFKNDFFQYLGTQIPVKSGVMRRIDNLPAPYKPLEFVFLQGSEDLKTYYKLQTASGSISVDVPTFTTVENGLGLFTSRTIHSEFRNMNAATQNALDTSRYTRNLNFRF